MKADAVFEGGGVKGIGLVGAVCRLEEEGYTWRKLAGTSAGAIIAALLAAGYKGSELKEIVLDLDYMKFQDKDSLQSIPLIGKALGLFIEKGMYSGDSFEKWMMELLKRKGKVKFKDISQNGQSNLKVIASDITRKNMLILPDDLKSYGIDPMEFEIARAVRMSISIPFFFKPIKLYWKGKVSYIVDGGILSDFPVWLFDTDKIPDLPVFGLRLVAPVQGRTILGKKDFISYLIDVVRTILEEDDSRYISNKTLVRTIPIPCGNVSTTEFNISRGKNLQLFERGYKAADDFLLRWDFKQYIKKYRKSLPPSRTETLWMD